MPAKKSAPAAAPRLSLSTTVSTPPPPPPPETPLGNVAPVAELSVAEPPEVTTPAIDIVNEVQEAVEQIGNIYKSLKPKIKAMKKVVFKAEKRKLKAALSVAGGAPPKPNALTRPCQISEDMLSFLGLPPGEMLSRSAVTSKIAAYSKENNLKDPENGRLMVVDDSLAKLLNVEPGTKVSLFACQGMLGSHIKTSPAP